ncbi:hypothetical protein ACTFIR_000724 [Dictyostelium discoideum]
MSTATATLVSLNAGIQGGKSLKNTYRDQISTDLFLDENGKLIGNIILCLQEIDRDFKDFKNYGNLKNKTSSRDKSKKENQLRIIHNNSNLKVIEEVFVNSGTRLQIVSFKLNDVYFVVINCHIPQKKSKEKAFENFFILEILVSKFIEKNIPFLIAGDINHDRDEINENLGNKTVSFANYEDRKTTTGRNSIDHIIYSSHNKSLGFRVLKNVTTSSEEAKINHYAIRSKFTLKKGTELYEGDIQRLYDLCHDKWKNLPTQQLNIKKENPRKKQNGKQNKTKNENINRELCSKVKPKFKKENGKWSAKKFHGTYFGDVECCYSTLLRFFKGETDNLNCKTALKNYLK